VMISSANAKRDQRKTARAAVTPQPAMTTETEPHAVRSEARHGVPSI